MKVNISNMFFKEAWDENKALHSSEESSSESYSPEASCAVSLMHVNPFKKWDFFKIA